MNSSEIKKIIDEIKHYLPHQAPLKDFIHHNSLHAFQHLKFFEAIHYASHVFGYHTITNIEEYIKMYNNHEITSKTIEDYIEINHLNIELKTQLFENISIVNHSKIGSLRKMWQKKFHININKHIHQILFKLISNYLDQGISKWQINTSQNNFLEDIKWIEKNSLISLFKTKRAKRLLLNDHTNILDLLKIVVGDSNYYKQYLFDQQFNHPGWSGMVAFLENHKETLYEPKNIKLNDIIFLELLFEIDILDNHFGNIWSPIAYNIASLPVDYTDFSTIKPNFLNEILFHWQNIFELENHKKYLTKIKNNIIIKEKNIKSFQAVFCIDDRMCSLRRHIETIDTNAETYGAAGFFYIDILYQPAGSKFYTKLCPAPLNPNVLIKEISKVKKIIKRDKAFHSYNQTLLGGWLYTNTIGYLKSVKLFKNIFYPSNSGLTTSSIDFFDTNSDLTIINKSINDKENGLQIGFTYSQMADKAENLLKTIGLNNNFSSLVYIIGHGASSTNNTHYAGYDCGACSGRPGIVNAKIMAFICNLQEVRILLKERGIEIPDSTFFIGGMHDTTRDEMIFTGLEILPLNLKKEHLNNVITFNKALKLNILERAEKFELVKGNEKEIIEQVRLRAFSLFEPRPELNHATNMMCIVGNREITYNIDLERKAFLNSYNYKTDKNGEILKGILNAITPVCGGINLEYFFSKVDNYNLGAGTKLPHNVVSLLGVSNGISGDLRIGLPSQMIEIHQPVRLIMLVEQYKEIVELVIKSNEKTHEWYKNDWVKLAVIDPESKDMFLFINQSFVKINKIL